MKNDAGRENEPTTSTTAEKGTAESQVASTWRMIGNTELVAGSPRQIVDGGLLGTCIAFLIALLSMQRKDIDASLHTALIAFVIALPTLAFGFLCTFYKKPRIVPHAGPANIFAAYLFGVWIVEGMGWIAAYIGLCFALRHISLTAFIAFLAASAFVWPILPFLSSIGLAVYAVRVFKKQSEQNEENSPAPPGDALVQVKETREKTSLDG